MLEIILSVFVLIIAVFLIYKFYFKNKHSIKIEFENALKFVFDSNSKNISVTLSSLKGHLEFSDKQTLDIIEKLIDSELITQKNEEFFITEDGKQFAINIIRNHRLWEKYLAEETGIHAKDWHLEAEKKEHLLSDAQTEQLNKILSNPLRDPHGDPIPTSSGKIFEHEGILLSEVEKIISAKIVHIEDEPREIYTKILDLQLYPQMEFNITKIDNYSWQIESENGNIIIPKNIGVNISIEKLDKKVIFYKNNIALSELKIGEEAIITKISNKLQGKNRRRLLDFGFIPEAKVRLSFENIAKDPKAFEIKSTIVALRNAISENILVRRINV